MLFIFFGNARFWWGCCIIDIEYSFLFLSGLVMSLLDEAISSSCWDYSSLLNFLPRASAVSKLFIALLFFVLVASGLNGLVFELCLVIFEAVLRFL